MKVFVKIKPGEAPCLCGATSAHQCDLFDARVACSTDLLHAFLNERYAGIAHTQVAEHVKTCARCGPWVKKRQDRARWAAGSGLLAAKLVRIVDAPRAAWPSAAQVIPEELRGRGATIVDVIRPYQERVEVRLHRAAKGTPRITVVVPLTWIERTDG